MTALGLVKVLVYFVLVTVGAVPLGAYIARVMEREGGRSRLDAIEQRVLRWTGVDPSHEMTWRAYSEAVLAFGLVGALLTYAIQRMQALLPLNPAGVPGVPADVAFNTAVSFVTNTNWQAYAGETTMSHLTQMVAWTVQNFVSAATGIAVLFALIRGWTRAESTGIGNFWVDLTRSTLWVLLPLSVVFALVLVSQGVVQTLSAGESVRLLDPAASTGLTGATQFLAMGPAASQIAIKQLGTNGGGFFNANSAHPFENPTALSNLLEMLAILLVPAALCFAFGARVRDRRQGWALYAAMLVVLVPLVVATLAAEQQANPVLTALGVDAHAGPLQSGGNMEGKEVRFGIADSVLWATATTAASNGSVNAMHDSFLPLGGLAPMWLIQLGEIVFGGVGSGLYGMLVYAVLTVFLAGLMVGRTPEYLGKKIEAYEMKLASLVILVPAAFILVGTALAALLPAGTSPLGNPATHGFSEILYALSSAVGNNGSAFGGLTASGRFYSVLLGVCMFVGRYWLLVPVLAIAGSLAAKKSVPPSAGTLPTHSPLFVGMLVGVIVLVGALTFVPALALGPVAEHLQLFHP